MRLKLTLEAPLLSAAPGVGACSIQHGSLGARRSRRPAVPCLTGYGHGDLGRAALDEVVAEVCTQAACVKGRSLAGCTALHQLGLGRPQDARLPRTWRLHMAAAAVAP